MNRLYFWSGSIREREKMAAPCCFVVYSDALIVGVLGTLSSEVSFQRW